MHDEKQKSVNIVNIVNIVLKQNQIVERGQIDIPNTQTHDN